MTADDLVEREVMFHRFQRLIAEVLRGQMSRTVFQPWEVELLVDIESCELEPKRRAGTFRQYVRAVITHGHGVLEMRAQAAVARCHGPAIVPRHHFARA